MIIIYSLRIIVLPCKINEILYYNLRDHIGDA